MKNGAPSFREVQDALTDAVQQHAQNSAATVPHTAKAYSTCDLSDSRRSRSSDTDLLRNIQELHAPMHDDKPNYADYHLNEANPSSPQRALTLQTETESATALDVSAMAGSAPPMLVLQRIQNHVEQAVAMMNEIKVPTVARAEMIDASLAVQESNHIVAISSDGSRQNQPRRPRNV